MVHQALDALQFPLRHREAFTLYHGSIDDGSDGFCRIDAHRDVAFFNASMGLAGAP